MEVGQVAHNERTHRKICGAAANGHCRTIGSNQPVLKGRFASGLLQHFRRKVESDSQPRPAVKQVREPAAGSACHIDGEHFFQNGE